MFVGGIGGRTDWRYIDTSTIDINLDRYVNFDRDNFHQDINFPDFDRDINFKVWITYVALGVTL